MRLEEYLLRLGDEWAAAHGRALATLGGAIANDGKFFERLALGKSVTTARFQSALNYFREAANWPDGEMPGTVQQLLKNLDGIAVLAGESAHHDRDLAA